MGKVVVFFFSCSLLLLAQSNIGELRLTVTDPSGLSLKSTVRRVSEANQYRDAFTTDDKRNLDTKRLPYGIYQIEIKSRQGSAATLFHGQARLRAIQRLDLALFIHAEHDRLLGRIEIEAHHIG
jgi:hypothetical protein